jgi:hypothetical protein
MAADAPATLNSAFGPFNQLANGSWTTSYRFKSGELVEVTVAEAVNLAANIDAVATLLDVLGEHQTTLRQSIATALLDTYNDGWNESDSPLTHAEFLGRVGRMTGALVWSTSELEAFFDDGDLFSGHTFIVDVAKDGSATNARFEG